MINSTIALIFSYITSIQMQNSIQLNCWFIISVMWINLYGVLEHFGISRFHKLQTWRLGEKIAPVCGSHKKFTRKWITIRCAWSGLHPSARRSRPRFSRQ